MAKSRVDLLLHATHAGDQADGVTASALHAVLVAALGDSGVGRNRSAWWAFESRLRQPRVQWQVCEETLSEAVPGDGLDYEFLIPENTGLNSTYELTEKAREVLNLAAQTWLDCENGLAGPCSLGDRFTTVRRVAGSSHRRITVLVCREPSNKRSVGLRDALMDGGSKGVLGGFPRRFILPIWGDESEYPAWAAVLREWTEAWMSSIQNPPVPVLVRFLKKEEHRVDAFRSALMREGVPYGPAMDAADSSGATYARRLAALASGDPLPVDAKTAERWLRSGVRLRGADSWRQLEASVNGAG